MGNFFTPPKEPMVIREEIVQALIDESIWTASFEILAVPNGNDLTMTFVTPAAPAIIAFEEITVNIEASANIKFLEAPTINTPAAPLISYNPNRPAAGATTVIVRGGDTLTANGTQLIGNPLGAGGKNQAVGASLTGDRGWILKPATIYTFLLNNNSGSAQDMGMIVRFLQV